MTGSENRYYLGVVIPNRARSVTRLSLSTETRIESSCELSAAEFERVSIANDTLHLYRDRLSFLDFVQWNLEEYLALEERLLLYGDKAPGDPFRSPDLNLNRCLLNFLASVRAYLDHTETDLKRRYGSNSDRYERFRQLTKTLYDRHFSYRFLYKFRNFAQHCGLPLDTFTQHSTPISRSIHVAVSRNRLLSDFDWGKLRPEIERLPEKVELTEFLCVHVQHLTSLHHSLCAEELPAIKEAAGLVLATAARVRDHPGVPIIFAIPSAPPPGVTPAGGRTLTLEQFPLFVALAEFVTRDLSGNSEAKA